MLELAWTAKRCHKNFFNLSIRRPFSDNILMPAQMELFNHAN
jgi:hypothetical protein